MTTDEGAPARAALDARSAQLGDVHIESAVAGNVYKGANPDELQAFVLRYMWERNQADDIEREQTRREIATIRLELWLWRIVTAAAILAYILRNV